MTALPSGSIAIKSNTIHFSVRELYAGRDFLMIFTTRVNSYIGTTIIVPDSGHQVKTLSRGEQINNLTMIVL